MPNPKTHSPSRTLAGQGDGPHWSHPVLAVPQPSLHGVWAQPAWKGRQAPKQLLV